MSNLQRRAKAFLRRPIPAGMDYVPDSIAEHFFVQYAQDGNLMLEPALTEILALIANDNESNTFEPCLPDTGALK